MSLIEHEWLILSYREGDKPMVIEILDSNIRIAR